METTINTNQTLQIVHQVAYTYLSDLGHTSQVAWLSLALFDELVEIHQLGQEERFWLECGAMLHDIGWVDGRQSHHKKSMQMVLDSQILPFENKERFIIASIARYHRKALPSIKHDHYAVLNSEERKVVSKLAALLRIADGLDYTHMNIVSRLRCEILPKKVNIFCQVSNSARPEFEQAKEKSDLFEQVYSRSVNLIEEGG
jgi:exopolyphosphatase/pppGpp-phosphohydrolase